MLSNTDLESMDYSYEGSPFINMSLSYDIDMESMDYSYEGSPFIVNPYTSSSTEVVNNAMFFSFNF